MDEGIANLIVQALCAGAFVTVKVTAGALIVALAIGMVSASVAALTSNRLVQVAIRVYVELLRNVPSLTFLFLLYFGLASLGVRLSSMAAAILGLGMIGGAVTVDIFRSGFLSVPVGQKEAAASIGLSPLLSFRLIVLPQGLKLAMPSVGNYAIGLIKDTSLVAAIAAPEVMFNARQLVNETFQTALIYGSAAVVYLVLTGLMAQSVMFIERRLETQ